MKTAAFLKDIAHKTEADLSKMVADKQMALRAFRFGNAGSKSKNVKEGRVIRKEIARIKTALSKLSKKA